MGELLTTKRIHIAVRSRKAASGDSKGMPPLTSGEPAFTGVRPQCPRCKANIDRLECQFCGFKMRVDHGIVYALPPERSSYYARFIADYERIRAAEGRGSQKDEFYLGLPYKDLSGRNSNQWKIRARSYDYLIKHVLIRNLQGEGGLILDLGAGNCWMSYRLALARFRPFAVDLLINDHDGLGAAEHFRKQLPAMFPRIEAEFARMPFQDEQFDAVVFNASFHYAENYDASLREAFRCVRKGGIVVVSDTPWYSREDSGRRMVAERRAAFLNRFGTASDSINCLEYLTDDRLRELEERLSIHWTIHSPWYGFKWAIRPLVAKFCNRREPSRFRIYAARKP
jgi:SAM-dependent methyltransferase